MTESGTAQAERRQVMQAGEGIGILAGGGRLPPLIAESVIARGGRVHIVAIEGEAGPEIEVFPHTWVNWGQVGRMVSTLRNERCRQLVIAGGVKRPDLTKIRPDLGLVASLPRIIGVMAGGDDSVLTRVVRFFEHKGLVVRGAHEVAPDLLAGAGNIGAISLSERGRSDAEIGAAVRAALGPLDAGQAAVVADGKVLAIEGAEGTDAMLRRVAELRRDAAAHGRSGVLAKGPKPGQELRIDMPAIGPRTIEGAVAAGLEGIAVEAGAVLILDKGETVQAADAAGLAMHGLPAGAGSIAAVQQVPGWREIGRKPPGRRDIADIERGVSAVDRLAPYDTGASVVVVRAYILAVETCEGTSAMLRRVGTLRQWGLNSKRRGVLVHRARGEETASDAERLLGEVAAERLAGVVVTGTDEAVAAYKIAAARADALDLFLVACGRASG